MVPKDEIIIVVPADCRKLVLVLNRGGLSRASEALMESMIIQLNVYLAMDGLLR